MPTNTTEVTEAKETTHPLLAREIRPIRNWAELLERWESAKSIEEMLGLLHAGFTVSLGRRHHDEKTYDSIDRLIFYFNIADGWADAFNILRKPEDRDRYYRWSDNEGLITEKSLSDLRRIIAQKAFDVLCLNVFKEVSLKGGGRNGDDFNDLWKVLFTSERFFPIIQNFFRSEESSSVFSQGSIRNLTCRKESSHNEKLAHEFLVNLARFIWGWKESNVPNWLGAEQQKEIREHNRTMRARLNSAKPWMVGVLVDIKRLDVLREWILSLDKACLAKLRQIALRDSLQQYRHPVQKDRRVRNLDEACYVGSRAAWFLKEHELVTQEHARLTSIRQAEIESEKAAEKIKQLAPKP